MTDWQRTGPSPQHQRGAQRTIRHGCSSTPGRELRERLAKITSQTRTTTPEDDRRHQDRTMDNQPEIGM